MTQKIANIAKNTSYFTLALILQKAISFTYFTLYARALGPEDLGKYYFALSFTTIFSIGLDLGVTNLLTREVAKNSDKARTYLSGAIGLKLCLAALTIAFLLLGMRLGHYSALVNSLILISVLSMLMDSFTTLLFAVSRALHNLKYESVNAVLAQLVTLLVSLPILYFNYGLVALMWAQVASSAFALLYAVIMIVKRWHLSLKPSFNAPWVKSLLLLSLPFGVYVIAQRFYTYIDSVILFRFLGERAVGIYQVPFRITTAFQFLPIAFIASLYPALSSYWKNNREQLEITFERAMNYSFILALPLTVGLASVAAPVVGIFKSGFSEAVLPLQVSSLTILFMFLNFPVGALLNACDRQKANTTSMIVTAVACAVLNLILIPLFGVMGAVYTAVLSSFLLFIQNWLKSRAIIKKKSGRIYLLAAKALPASLIMGAAIYFLNSWFNILIVVVLSAVIYFICLLLFGAIKPADLKSVAKSFKKS